MAVYEYTSGPRGPLARVVGVCGVSVKKKKGFYPLGLGSYIPKKTEAGPQRGQIFMARPCWQ